MSEIKILHCPFCGGEAELIGHYIKAGPNNFQYFVRCKKCKVRPQPLYTFKKKEKAVEVWNTRKTMERIVERLETASFWTEPDDECDESWEAVWLDKAIKIVRECNE